MPEPTQIDRLTAPLAQGAPALAAAAPPALDPAAPPARPLAPPPDLPSRATAANATAARPPEVTDALIDEALARLGFASREHAKAALQAAAEREAAKPDARLATEHEALKAAHAKLRRDHETLRAESGGKIAEAEKIATEARVRALDSWMEGFSTTVAYNLGVDSAKGNRAQFREYVRRCFRIRDGAEGEPATPYFEDPDCPFRYESKTPGRWTQAVVDDFAEKLGVHLRTNYGAFFAPAPQGGAGTGLPPHNPLTSPGAASPKPITPQPGSIEAIADGLWKSMKARSNNGPPRALTHT